ncbi:MAG: CopG family antitoxin [Chthoniobacterales bacterium]
MKKKIPTFNTDKDAQDFVDTADLTQYDLSGGMPVQFEFEPKSANLNMRVPKPLLDAVKERARVRGIPYTRFIRQLMEREVSDRGKPGR